MSVDQLPGEGGGGVVCMQESAFLNPENQSRMSSVWPAGSLRARQALCWATALSSCRRVVVRFDQRRENAQLPFTQS